MILVVGATGLLGGRVVELLAERDESVRAFLRPGSAAPAWRDPVDVVTGDLTDPASLQPACTGVSTIVATATAIGRRLAGAGGPSIREVDELGMAALVAAADEAGVKRFVYLSYAGVDAGLGFPVERAKRNTERLLQSTRMRPVIVRPDAFQDVHLTPAARFDMGQGKISVFGSGSRPQRWVSADDAAHLVAAVATEADPPRVVEFGGPEPLSRNEAIAVAERVTGKRMKVQRMPLWAARLGMRLLARRNDALASVFGLGVLQDQQVLRWDDGPLRDRGVDPLSATDFIERQARSLP